MDASSALFQAGATSFASSDPSSDTALQASTKPVLEFRIQLSDKQGKPVSTIYRDDTFLMQVYVKDLRDLPADSLRVFSVYTDLYLDPSLFIAAGVGRLGSDFFKPSGESVPNEIGGLATSPYPHDIGHLLFEMPVRSIAEGVGTIATKPIRNASDYNATLLYGSDKPLASDLIQFSALPITVIAKTKVDLGEANSRALTVSSPSRSPERLNEVVGVAPPINTSPALDTPLVTTTSDSAQKVSLKIPSDKVQGRTDFAPLTFRESRNSVKMPLSLSGLKSSSLNDVPFLNRLTASMQLRLVQRPSGLLSPAYDSAMRSNPHQNRVAIAVIDRMLERLEAGSSLEVPSLAFEWEASYSRVAIRSLPLYQETVTYRPSVNVILGLDGYAEVFNASGRDEYVNLNDSANALPSIKQNSRGPNQSFELAVQRSSLKLLPFSPPSRDPLLSDLNSVAATLQKQTDPSWINTQPDVAPVEKSDAKSANDMFLIAGIANALQASRTRWTSTALAGIASLYLVFRGRRRKILDNQMKV